MSCATELLHPANFCPVCGARLAAPSPDGSAATEQPGEPHAVHLVSDRAAEVHYLPGQAPVEPLPVPLPTTEQAMQPAPGTPVGENPEAHRYSAQQPVPDPPRTTDDNPFGDFFSDGPSAWLEDDDMEDVGGARGVRPMGSASALVAILSLVAAWTVWGAAMVHGAGGAEAGGFVLVSMLAWIWYLALPRDQQHDVLLAVDRRAASSVDRLVDPLRARTSAQLGLRRERDKYRSMRDERTRRVAALGERAYRSFRAGSLPHELQDAAQRVMAIERQMMLQDHRIHSMVVTRDVEATPAPPDGADAARAADDTGHAGA